MISNFISSNNIRFVLLRNPENIKIKESTFSGTTKNAFTNETIFNIEFKSDFDPKSSDNPYSSFSDAIMATYFWIGGNWVQTNDFDFWAVDVFTLIAKTKGRQTLLRRRANHIADYEALFHIHLWNMDPEPKHIYYFGQSRTLEEWYKTRNDQGAIYR
ncbi:hypothetical protein RclHR1_02170010 [Rhizophagus clarus]|uniref:Uncharacterized protein n=1 Tax=Rhizophagus clarus TaxID=94130 RepID=A0A2Z6R6F1_9GLOM|nr:hypothetical protein RclHR1_02170010 [Rhizophagus clarus]GES94215.1 hypothetical protein GLOIN_2v1769896 [Rhizophagus clarus]